MTLNMKPFAAAQAWLARTATAAASQARGTTTQSLSILGLAICAGLSCAPIHAYAQDEFAHPVSYQFDGGPLGQLEGSAAIDGYFFAQSGAGNHSVIGPYATGAKVDAWETEVGKTTGLLQFDVQAAEYQDINLGTNAPKNINGNRFQTGPIRTVYVALAPTDGLKISVGQLPSLEGYETVFAWNNPVALRSVIAGPENSNSKGIQADYTNGAFSGTALFSDGYDTNVFNYLQLSGTYKINPSNEFTVVVGVPFGVVGPNAFAYGNGGLSSGGANGVGGQQLLAEVNSNLINAWYTWRDGNLRVVPEIQAQYTPKLTQFANQTSGGISDNIPKSTGYYASALFLIYKFANTPYSISGWADYGSSYGSAPQDVWFTSPGAQLVGFAVAPAWKDNNLYARLNLGYSHLVNIGTPAAGYGISGTARNTVIGLMEFGFVF